MAELGGLAGVPNANTISSTPDNSFNQFSATGGVNLSSTTKLVATGSYARNTQNVAFIRTPARPWCPVSSLNGLMVNTSFSAKLTSQAGEEVEHQHRVSLRRTATTGRRSTSTSTRTPTNRCPRAEHADFPLAQTIRWAPSSAQNANANRPYSRRMNQFDAEADFAVAARQQIKASYGFEKLDYSCPGSWVNCADAPTTHEQTLRAEWRTGYQREPDRAGSATRTPSAGRRITTRTRFLRWCPTRM